MRRQGAGIIAEAICAHGASRDEDLLRLRELSPGQRSELIESACEAAAAIARSRRAAGFAEVEPAPWPLSTWEFLKEQAARVRS